MKNKILCMVLLLIAGGVVVAEKAYKSIDESGQVTYSSSPPENAVKSKPVIIPVGPTDEQKRDATQRADSAEEQAEALRRERAEAQRQAGEAASPLPQSVEPVEVVGTTADRRRPDRLSKLPSENPTGEDHPVYQPDKGPGKPPSVQPPPRPRPLPAGK